jgi:uncharacterized protein YcfL
LFFKTILFVTALILTGCGGTSQEPPNKTKSTTSPTNIDRNYAPVSYSQRVVTHEDTNKTVTLTSSDSNEDNLTYSITTYPQHGVLSGEVPNLTYSPNENFNGSDSFSFKSSDSKLDSNIATITITINSINDSPVITTKTYKDSFEKKVINSSVKTASSIFSIDLNQDGRVDILTTSEDDKRVVWLENIGSYNYKEHNISTTMDGAKSILGVDFDKDGDIDILATAWRDDKIVWFENSGDQNFTPYIVDSSSDGAYDLKVADMDSDGDLDIVAVSYDDDSLSWYKNTNLSFTKIVLDTNLISASSIEIYDVNSDGYQDIVASSFALGDLYWYRQSSGSFFKNTIYDNQDGTNSIFIDSSGIYSTNYNSQNIILSTISGVDFTNTTISSLYQPNSLKAKDLDGDGDQDIVVGSFSANSVIWYENNGSSYLAHNIEGYGKASDIEIYDIDSDGDEDILASDFENAKITLYESKDSIFIYENNISVTKIDTTDIDGDTLTLSLGGDDSSALDINSSGYITFNSPPDFENPTDSDKNNMYNITIWVSDGNKSVKKDLRVVVKNLTRFKKNTIKENLGVINDIAVKDGNITVVSNQDPKIYILDKNGTQTNITTSFNRPNAVEYINNDIAISFFSSDTIALYSTGSFNESTIDNNCDGASDIVVSDIDDNGRLDIASSCFNGEMVKWYLQQNDNSFITSTFDLGVGKYPWAISTHGNNHKDLVVALPDTDEIYKLQNDGSENFTTKVLDSDARGANDVNGRFAVSLYDNKLSFYNSENNKTIINRPSEFAALNSLDIGDLDGDGDQDIVTTSKDDGKVVWFENLGNSSYKQSLITHLKEPVKAVINDFNSDGLNDIIVATETKIIFLQNTSTESLF